MRRLAGALALGLLAGCASRGEHRGDGQTAASASKEPAAAAPSVASVVPRADEVESFAAARALPLPVATARTTRSAAEVARAPRSGTAGDTPETRRPYRDDIPRARMGGPPRPSILDDRPGQVPVTDPERDSVVSGRRVVERRDDDELSGTYASADDLAQAVLDALASNDPEPLHELHITRTEFERLFWPEFPQSRPATRIPVGDAWGFHYAACCDGVSAGLTQFGGRSLHLRHVRYDEGFAPYTNFSLYQGTVIEAIDDHGVPVEVDVAAVFVERKGRWKVYMFDS